NKLINRFSEDIDIVLLKQKRESSNQLKNKLKKITKAVEKVIPEIELEGITKINLSEALRHLCVALRNSFLGYYAAITQRYAKNHKGSQRKNTRLLIKQQKLYK
ncbi:MAG: nucleotidyl transferase AbiEii/AbiGii toxin family protein, partial [Bacteroidota bacterium]|nr:nucleotidyl transferase AbiEii/AbiGii toxin family protein [Bacteroidota bacterium]